MLSCTIFIAVPSVAALSTRSSASALGFAMVPATRPAAAPSRPRAIGRMIHLRRALSTDRPHGSYCASIGVSTSYSFISVQPVLRGRVTAAG